MVNNIWLIMVNNSIPLNPMVLLIIIPMKNGYFIGNINPTFSDFPHTASGGIETTIASLNSKGHRQPNLHIKSVYCGFTVNDPMTQPFYDPSAI